MSNNNTDGTIRILQNHFDRIFLDQLFDESLVYNAIIRRNLITNHFPFIPEIEVEMQTKAELTAFTKFMKIILNVIKITIVEEEWDLASIGFKVFLGLCNNSCDKPYINNNITNMTNLAHLIFANQNADYNIIYDCGAFLIHLIEIKPKLFAKENLVISTLKLILLRISNEKTIIIGGLLELTGFGMPKLSTEEKLIADANSVYCTIIDKINEHIPGKYHKQFILQSIMDGLNSNQHDEFHLKQKKMSLIVAGLSCDGLKDLFSDELSILLPKIIDSLINHPKLMIRECASYCLCQFSDYLDQSMDKYYQILIPAQLSVMNDSITLQFTTSHFFDNFLELVNYQQIQEFVPSIYEHISHLLFSSNPNQNTHNNNNNNTNNNNNNNNSNNSNNDNNNNQNNDNYSIFLQSRGLVMLSAFILCLEENIRIYQLSIISILKPLLINHQSEYFLLRGLALNTMGHLMKSLKCQGIDQEIVDIAIESAITNFELSKENDELMEDGFIFFLNIAAELKDQFSKYLIQIMPKVFEILKDPKCLDSEYHLLEYQQQFEQQQEQQPQQDQQDQQDQEEGGNDDQHHLHQHHNHNHDDEDEMEEIPFDFDLPAKKLKLFLNKITRILNFVAVVAFYTEKQFEPYFNEMIEIIFHYETIGLIHSSFEEIRAECMLLIHSLMVVHCSIHNIPQIKKITDPMNREEFELIVSFWDHCLDCLLLAIKEDESRKVVHNVFGTITRCCQNYGKSLLGYRIDEIFDGIIFYLNHLAPCQQSIEEDDQDEDDDDDDNDDEGKGKEEEEEEGNGGGDHDDENDCLKDLINILDIFCKILLDDYIPYFENIQSLLLKFMKSNYSITQRSDALYCYSSIIDHLSPQITQKYIQTILPILEQICQSAESSSILRGNAILVLSMIIDKYKNYDYFISDYSRFFQWLLMWLIQEDQDVEEGKTMEISDSMDNCIIAMAQIILQFFARKKEKEISLLPLEKAFPMILKYLPLRDDEEPKYAEIVHEMLLNRLKEKDPRLINDEGLVKKVIELFGETFRSEAAVTNQSIEAMQFFERSYPSLLEKYLKRLTEKGEKDQLVAIQKAIQQ